MQIVWSLRRGSRNIKHIGPAHEGAELEVLQGAARQRLAGGRMELDLGLDEPRPSGPLEIRLLADGSPVGCLCRVYDALGFRQATGA